MEENFDEINETARMVKYNGEPYYIEETETHTILTSVHKNENGRYFILEFIKDEEKSKQVLERVAKMIKRAIIRGDI